MMEQESYIFGCAETIDKHLSDLERPLHRRPLEAALLFVEIYVVKVSSGSKHDPIGQPWFDIILYHFHDWYRLTYGDKFSEETNRAQGVVLLRNIPVLIEIPYTYSEVEVPREQSWLVFPYQLDDVEHPEKWLVDAPVLDRLPSSKWKRDIELVVTARRQIGQHIGTAKIDCEIFAGLISDIEVDLDNAALCFVKNTKASLRSAIWPLHMAMEKSLKALARQQKSAHLETHDLFRLYDDIDDVGSSALRQLLNRFPRSGDVINARYGQMSNVNAKSTWQYYKSTLQLVSGISRMYDRKISISNLRILLRKPGWMELANSAK